MIVVRPRRLDSRRRARLPPAVVATVAAALAATTVLASTQDFAALMEQAMTRMHHAMMQPGRGDPDRDFATMMIPHHQGAVDMAKAELQFGKEPRLRRLAQGIIVEQAQEIAVMRQVLADTPSAHSPTHHEGPGQ